MNGDSGEALDVRGVGVKCAWNGRGMGYKNDKK